MSDLLLTVVGKSIFKFKELGIINKENYQNMESDNDIISKLKFIGKIQKGEKINVKSMYVQPDGIATRISRSFINVDTRSNTLNFVNNVIKRSFDLINLHSTKDTAFDRNLVKNLMKDLRDSIIGIINLKETYSTDVMFCCKLDTLIQDIEGHLSEIETEFSKVEKEEKSKDDKEKDEGRKKDKNKN